MNLAWSDVRRDLQVALIQFSDDLRIVLGGSRGHNCQSDFLGFDTPSGAFASELIDVDDFETQVDLSRYEISAHCRRLFELIAEPESTPIENVADLGVHRDHLNHFLEIVRRSSLVGNDYDRAALWETLNQASSYIAFADAALRAMTEDERSEELFDLTNDDLARVGGVQSAYVRNSTSPTKGRIRSEPQRKAIKKAGHDIRSFVRLNTVDAIEWLATLRRFRRGRLSAPAIDLCIRRARTADQLGRIAGVAGWINIGATERIADTLCWPVEKVIRWVRSGDFEAPDDAFAWGNALGIDGDLYAAKIFAFNHPTSR
ncbi:MAG: hypothetical protein IT548_04490 [Alphaproteobacteria bacterium]|nr:hypothetical protein [Alphaproteobacteria bacterium]